MFMMKSTTLIIWYIINAIISMLFISMCKLDQTQNYNMIWATYSCTVGFCIHCTQRPPGHRVRLSPVRLRGGDCESACMCHYRVGEQSSAYVLRRGVRGATATATAVHPHVRMGMGGSREFVRTRPTRPGPELGTGLATCWR
jgi:hypothetical protein